MHEDVAKSITMQELQRAKDEWMCSTLNDLYDEMELWTWTEVQHNRWARAMKASNQVGVRPTWPVDQRGREKAIELGHGNQATTSTKGENRQSGWHLASKLLLGVLCDSTPRSNLDAR